ncbi:hypothetical protein CMQ_6514 [Grosmannia clavigera kw1407]|uniref:Aminoglycoside phosphotransferase domain-containing protein n=1 Tax=Grosmannia clavigera (strain kw1407 / UAMH 11150) TaxID=655863 RepID=F0X6K5_GROCL|nr:uncharacterized protein CMQ_6514 [Grosmannia clavigera kw1407]EFX06193.1 hypothetical protein CMQ_6514 [Grosmannia clavigera kw1407]
MLSAVIRIARSPWVLAAAYLPRLWTQVLRLARFVRVRPPSEALGTSTTTIDGRQAGPVASTHQAFPATEDQLNEIRKRFIESIDPDAVCALASRLNHGKPCQIVRKARGSFNICFFVEFGHDGPKWIIRIPIESSLEDPWTKLLSEVATMRHLQRNTRIPIPHIHAYGRGAKLTRDGQRRQMFVILHLVLGQPLDKELLTSATEDDRRRFYSQLIDVLADLRKLEFPMIGSLMPNPVSGQEPVLGPVVSMSAAIIHRPLPPKAFATAKEYMDFQCNVVSDFLLPPISDCSVLDARHEVFTRHGIEPIFQRVIDPRLNDGPFVLNHLDLRGPNIIVDENLRIQGIIDWEFTSTVPLQLFAPPSWITGYDPNKTNKQMHAEFRNVLASKKGSVYSQLRREWYSTLDTDNVRKDVAFWVSHAIRRPAKVTDIFCDVLAPRLSGRPLDDVVSEFFDENPEAEQEVQQRLQQCERYREYLKENGLYETTRDRALAESKAVKKTWGWSSFASRSGSKQW